MWIRIALIGALCAACSTTESPEPDDPAPDAARSGVCSATHVVDGRFTNWPGRAGCWEWETTSPLLAEHGAVYLAYQEDTLHLLWDWQAREEPLHADDYALIALTTGGGQEQWLIRVFGNGKVHVIRNGFDFGGPSEGAVSVEGSPLRATPHAIAELALNVLPGTFTVGLSGSDTDAGGPDVVHSGHVGDEVDGFATPGPHLTSAHPPRGVGGDTTVLRGVGFGDGGKVYFDADEASVLAWSETAITVVVVPPISEDRDVVVQTTAGPTNPIRFFYDCQAGCEGGACAECPSETRCAICPPDVSCVDGYCACQPQCADRNCGSDGCGGVCGSCLPTEYCGGGTCTCKQICGPLDNCGDDGCGGVCGVCAAGGLCLFKKCCLPSCAGKQCGSDGCSKQCGTCPDGFACKGNACVCAPDCSGKQCGPDGCGGNCGVCVGGYVCQGDQCNCVPNCIGELGQLRECGPNGCGAACGICPDDEYCTKIGLCAKK